MRSHPCLRLLASVLCLVALWSCATPQLTVSHERAALSKSVAEYTYKALYAEFRAGRVPAPEMARMTHLYERWRATQAAYVASLEAGREPPPEVQAAMRATLQAMLDLAQTHHLM